MGRTKRSFLHMSRVAVAQLEQNTRDFHQAAREVKTQADHNRYVRYYKEVCHSRNVRAMPASAFGVACFLVAYATAIGSVASLDNALSAVRTELRESIGQEFTSVDEWHLKKVRRGLRKSFRAPVRRKQPMTLAILVQLLSRLDLSKLPDLMHISMAFLAHDGCFRMGDVVNLRWSDVFWEMGADGAPKAVKIVVRVSKARYESAPEDVRIPRYKLGGVYLCAVQFLWLYMQHGTVLKRVRDNPEAYLFDMPSPQSRAGVEEDRVRSRPTFKNMFITRLRQLLREAGLKPEDFAGHSFRAGGATDLHSGGLPTALGMMLGRWRSQEAYFLYLRERPDLQGAHISAAFETAFADTA